MEQIEILELVSGLDFPVSRADLIRLAQERGAGNETLAKLRALPAIEFATPDDLDQALVLKE
ncbi:MAG TPA: DUF2795 domain-containing protein [Candidatus Limnocylindrales bacterium]|nr:DUF2795 domain-containing protein [Candidatus Limnocylindrales bacterium]